jgi:ketosteroid isomerase-like protein
MNIAARKALIVEYYKRVDAQDIDWVLDLFTADSRYVRADADYTDKQAITDFYRNDRKIAGVHSVDRVVAECDQVLAAGVFKGVGADGAPKNVGFCDIWELRGDKVCYRQTYLSMGADYVKY